MVALVGVLGLVLGFGECLGEGENRRSTRSTSVSDIIISSSERETGYKGRVDSGGDLVAVPVAFCFFCDGGGADAGLLDPALDVDRGVVGWDGAAFHGGVCKWSTRLMVVSGACMVARGDERGGGSGGWEDVARGNAGCDGDGEPPRVEGAGGTCSANRAGLGGGGCRGPSAHIKTGGAFVAVAAGLPRKSSDATRARLSWLGRGMVVLTIVR